MDGIFKKDTPDGKPPLTLTEEEIHTYIAEKEAAGVKPTATAKYRCHLRHLCQWLPADRILTQERLIAWRADLEAAGYSPLTVEKYVTDAHLYLKYRGRSDLNIKKSNAKDLRGHQFGYLTAIEPTDRRYRHDVIWRCRCRCGKETEVPTSSLTTGNTASCGCLSTDILDFHNRYVDGTELRQAMEDRPISTRAAGGYTGVTASRGKWLAYITYKKRYYRLGSYIKKEDAVKARARAKDEVINDATRLYEMTRHRYTVKPVKPVKPPKPHTLESTKTKQTVSVQARRCDNTSGCAGVCRIGAKWKAMISHNKQRYHLGLFEKMEEAIAVRHLAEEYILAGEYDKLVAISHSITSNKDRSGK